MTLSDFRKMDQDVWSYEEEQLKESIKELKEEYPCCMKKRKCEEGHGLRPICMNCRFKFKIDKIFGVRLSEEVRP